MKLIAPCPPTRSTGPLESSGLTTHMPSELVSEQVRRISIFSAVVGALWAYALFLDVVVVPLFLPQVAAQQVHGEAIPIEIGGIVVSLGTWLYLRRSCRCDETKTAVGLGYLVACAIGIALINNWIAPPPAVPGLHLSWITNVILVFSIVAPLTNKWMLPAMLIAAMMDPLAAWLAHLRGIPTLSFTQTLLLYAPNVIAALLAVMPGKIMRHVSRRLREAQELGSYQLVELLGHGGMGEVWRAKHRLLARNAAIKLVRPEKLGAGNAEEGRRVLRRFEREAQATASLSSPHTIRLFDFGMTDDGTFYYVMELLSGRDLESLVKEFGPVPASRALMILRQTCHSLADAHARGMVHRDIKPANIYLCRMGLEYDFVKVLDFGLVKLGERTSSDTLVTLEQTTTGTPAYMAPEIVLGDEHVDRRADVYALGCVAYYLLTGALVFEADTSMKMMLKHLQEIPIPPSQRTELPIPRDVDELVMACLEKDPAKRPQNAQELLRLLNRVHEREPWSPESAANWWELHLTDMTGPLSLGGPESQVTGAVGVVGATQSV